MAWEVAVILNPNCDPSAVDKLARYMPIWMADTPSNQSCVSAARYAAGNLWEPEPSCTTFPVFAELSPEDSFVNIFNTVTLHHPRMAKLNILGLEDTGSLRSHMDQLDFKPAKATWDNTLAFRKPISMLENVQHVILSAKRWRTSNDVYDDLFCALGSPTWHGKNFNALHDSIVTGQINTLEIPYTLTIREISSAKSEARLFVDDLVSLIRKFEAEGCPISIHVE